jgi:hypothetical protein
LLPFRSQPSPPRLSEGYRLAFEAELPVASLNTLLQACGHPCRSDGLWHRVLAHSSWHLALFAPSQQLVGFVRATSDRALNANLWDLMVDPCDPHKPDLFVALVQTALSRLRRELGGCSISLSAPPEALPALKRAGFVVNPGGIRAMGMDLKQRE